MPVGDTYSIMTEKTETGPSVWFDKSRNKYHASIRINKKTIHLKRYNTAEEAYEAYCKAAAQIFGEYARFE